MTDGETEIAFEVRNTGTPIEPALQQRIFNLLSVAQMPEPDRSAAWVSACTLPGRLSQRTAALSRCGRTTRRLSLQ